MHVNRSIQKLKKQNTRVKDQYASTKTRSCTTCELGRHVYHVRTMTIQPRSIFIPCYFLSSIKISSLNNMYDHDIYLYDHHHCAHVYVTTC